MLLTSGFPGKPAIWHMQDRPLEERLRLHGRGYIDPLDPVVAGDYLTVAFHFNLHLVPRLGRTARSL